MIEYIWKSLFHISQCLFRPLIPETIQLTSLLDEQEKPVQTNLFNRSLLDETAENRLSRIPGRLKNSVTQLDILNWLGNFKTDEYDHALSILEVLEYVSEPELVEFLEFRLKTLFDLLPENTKVMFIPIADYGKSSTLLIYYLKKTPFYRDHATLITIIRDPGKLKARLKEPIETKPVVVLFDDFLGSGKSLFNYAKTSVIPQFAVKNIEANIMVLCIYYLEKSSRYLKDKFGYEIKIIGEIRHAAFERGASPFTGEKRVALRTFCYHYGKDIFATHPPYEEHPLGFENSQALIIFPYNPPNNTVPILWASRFSVPENRYWIPLYPRVSEAKISAAKKLRGAYAFEMSLLRTTGLERVFYSGKVEQSFASRSFITNTDFKTFAYLRLRMKKRSDPVICQLLGITLEDLDSIKADAISRNLFDASLDLTAFGKKNYESIMDILAAFKERVSNFTAITNEQEEILYLPSVFRGQKKKLD